METPCYVEQSLALLSGATSQPTCLCCIAQHRSHLSLLAAEPHKFLQWNTLHSKAQPKRHCIRVAVPSSRMDVQLHSWLVHPCALCKLSPLLSLGQANPARDPGFLLLTAGGRALSSSGVREGMLLDEGRSKMPSSSELLH